MEGIINVSTRGCGRGVSGLGWGETRMLGVVVVVVMVARDGKPGRGAQHWWRDGWYGRVRGAVARSRGCVRGLEKGGWGSAYCGIPGRVRGG